MQLYLPIADLPVKRFDLIQSVNVRGTFVVTQACLPYLRESDHVSVPERSGAHLTFRGGGVALLCAGSDASLGVLVSQPGRPVQPTGEVRLANGRVLVDTHTTTRAFSPLKLSVGSGGSTVLNAGVARYAVDSGSARANEGDVTRDGIVVPLTDEQVTCGDGVALPAPMEPHTRRVEDRVGYDGQFYHLMAHDPLIRRGI